MRSQDGKSITCMRRPTSPYSLAYMCVVTIGTLCLLDTVSGSIVVAATCVAIEKISLFDIKITVLIIVEYGEV